MNTEEERETEEYIRGLIAETVKKISPSQVFRDIRALLVWADDPQHIAGLEAACGMTQAESIDDWIEGSCYTNDPDIKPFVGGKGTPEERRAAFRFAMALQGFYPK